MRKREKIKANERGRAAKPTYKISSPVVNEMLNFVLLPIHTKQKSK